MSSRAQRSCAYRRSCMSASAATPACSACFARVLSLSSRPNVSPGATSFKRKWEEVTRYRFARWWAFFNSFLVFTQGVYGRTGQAGRAGQQMKKGAPRAHCEWVAVNSEIYYLQFEIVNFPSRLLLLS